MPATYHTRKRRLEARVFRVLMLASVLVIAASLGAILWSIVSKGIRSLNWEMITQVPGGGFYIGKGGGILNAILGSLYISLGSVVLGLGISVPAVLYLNAYSRQKTWFAGLARLVFDVLFGIPSIVYGAFGFTVMVVLGLKTSLLAGIVTVTLMIVPILARAMDEVVRLAPPELSDATYSLGATRWETAQVLLRQSLPGILTAILLAFGRAIGDAATVLFTAGYTDSVPTSLNQPAATLPLAIFFQLSSPMAAVQNRAYAAAIILTVIVLAISLTGKFLQQWLSRHRI
ncbi:MAG TPA: phosphate ABC transporter permease PstA [Dinghuibacter sp.]|jgi:phosphate transport system permease protein|uniref:phosphate ABC transporter permease PstA n=1 Tax=Dinghuibacter sp. TaxID=2024697 RepID=UPI002C545C37|nr:phosphate ABC transporter permease PstA [Dinghuibacter sp.]HTJ11593.1 phosphate ABC transporter permease PstA [Dinghuibacter sp.]